MCFSANTYIKTNRMTVKSAINGDGKQKSSYFVKDCGMEKREGKKVKTLTMSNALCSLYKIGDKG